MNINNAYLNSNLDEEIYIILSSDYSDVISVKSKMLLLQRELYGLKQSARKWNKKFEYVIKKMGFRSITADKCIFIRVSSSGEFIIIALYVNDILIETKTQSLIDETKKRIHQEFKTTNADSVSRILDI